MKARSSFEPHTTSWLLFCVPAIALFALGVHWRSLFAGDTDLWYHLSGGRYIATTGSLPASSFFSFLEPARPFTDYYWLFQYAVYMLHAVAGYSGIAALRVLMFACLMALAAALFAPASEEGDFPYVLRRFSFLALGVLLASRYPNFRPHAFSYLFALGFLYILERREKAAWLLPIIALLWVNFHGITYPVLFVIALSYLGQIYLRRLRSGVHMEPETLRTAFWLALSMGAVFATPHGSDLLTVPFRMSEKITFYIQEMARPSLGDISVFTLDWLLPRRNTAMVLLLLVGAAAVGRGLLRGRLRAAHLLLYCGGAYLLTRAGRFQVEFAILSLPLVASFFNSAPLPGDNPDRSLWRWFFPLALLASLLAFVWPTVRSPGKIPFGPGDLPTGAARFLKESGGGGRLLNHPTPGGYLQWELHPQYTIFMDMQVPFLFLDEEMFLYNVSSVNELALARLLALYRPDYLLDRVQTPNYKETLAKQPGYKVVYVDHDSVLYASAAQKPEVVAKFEVTALPHYTFGSTTFDKASKEGDPAKILAELERLHSQAPEGGTVNIWLSQAYLWKGDYDKALAHARAVIESYPDRFNGYLMVGEAQRKAGDPAGSVESLGKALELSSGPARRAVERSLALSLQELDRTGEAYAHMRNGVFWTDPALTAEDYWRLACLAMVVGRNAEAVEAARYADLMVKPGEEELKATIGKFLALVGASPILREAQETSGK